MSFIFSGLFGSYLFTTQIKKNIFYKNLLTNDFIYAIILSVKCAGHHEPGCSAVGSAPALGAGCRRFKSCHSDHYGGIAQLVRVLAWHARVHKFDSCCLHQNEKPLITQISGFFLNSCVFFAIDSILWFLNPEADFAILQLHLTRICHENVFTHAHLNFVDAMPDHKSKCAKARLFSSYIICGSNYIRNNKTRILLTENCHEPNGTSFSVRLLF